MRHLENNTIHIWQINLNLDNNLSSLAYYLDKKEDGRANRFVFERHKRRFILSHIALRKILSKYLKVEPPFIKFKENKYGKLFVLNEQNNSGIQFNLSHSQDSALIAISKNNPVGIDIEYFSQRNLVGLANYSFSKTEANAIKDLSVKEQKNAFFHIWTQKEAFIKAIGQGLSYPLKSFCVATFPPAAITSSQYENIENWFIKSFQINQQSYAAVAALKPIDKVEFYDFHSI